MVKKETATERRERSNVDEHVYTYIVCLCVYACTRGENFGARSNVHYLCFLHIILFIVLLGASEFIIARPGPPSVRGGLAVSQGEDLH